MLFHCSFLYVFTYSLSLVSIASSLPADRQFSKRNATELSFYFGVTSTEHEEKSTALKAKGYRPISLSLYGTPPEVKYAAVWIQGEEEDTPYETIHTVDKTTYDSWLASWKAKGYVSTHIAATGSAEDAAYAGVMEKRKVTNWAQYCGMDSPWAFSNATGNVNMLIKGVSMYGTPVNRRYCILGHENVENRQQTVFYQTNNFPYDYREVYAAEVQKRFWRPTYLDVASDGLITPLFDDTSVGKWVAQDDLTEAQLTTEVEKQAAESLSPIHIQGGGDEGDNRYAVIFAEHSTPFPRQWSATGAVTGFANNTGVMNGLDNVMKTFMRINGIRQAQVAASLNNTVIAERAYTWAEEDRKTVQPDHQFLLASVSKMFTHAATQSLIDAGRINLTTTVYPLLGYEPADSRANNITVGHLIDHTAGYDRSISGDIGFIFTDVARSKNSTTPATLRDVIEYVVARPLDFTPGDYSAYSNFGTMLLSYIITNLTGIEYHDYIQANVLNGLKVSLYETKGESHVDDPIVQETKFTGLNPLQPMSESKVPAIYGGDGAIKEETIGAFALKASASTIARFIGSNAVNGIGGRAPYSYRDGSLSGARTFAESRPDIDWAITLNTREYTSEENWSRLIFWDIPDVWNLFPPA